MTAVIAEKIPFGKYYVQEIATDEHYVLNGEKLFVVLNVAAGNVFKRKRYGHLAKSSGSVAYRTKNFCH